MKILSALIGVMVVFLVLGLAIPQIWPLITETSGNITAMEGTDAGTEIIQAFWPIALTLVGLGLGVAIIFVGIKKFQNLG